MARRSVARRDKASQRCLGKVVFHVVKELLETKKVIKGCIAMLHLKLRSLAGIECYLRQRSRFSVICVNQMDTFFASSAVQPSRPCIAMLIYPPTICADSV